MKGKTKKLALLSLLATMSLSCGFAVAGLVPSVPTATTVNAEEAQTEAVEGVAKIGDTAYATFAEALTAANAMTGNVTVEIYDKVTLTTGFKGSYDSITFVGKATDAEIYLEIQGYIEAPGKTVNFTDLILSKSEGGYIGNAGAMNYAFGVYNVNSVTYTNCTFANGAYASSGNVTFEGCTFYRSYDKYGLWAYGNVTTTVNKCTFPDIRGIKLWSEGLLRNANLTVTNTNFSAVTDKPAIVLTSGESVTLAGNTYSSTKGALELDLDGVPNGTPITSTDAITCVYDSNTKDENGNKIYVDCGVMVDGKIYTTVTDAKGVATAGSTVTLLHNSTEMVEFADGVMLDTNGYTAANVTADVTTAAARIGYTYYESFEEALKAVKAGGTLTLMRNVEIADKWDCRTYKNSAPVTIDGNGHTLKFTGQISDGYNYMAVFRFEAPATVKNLTMDMSEAISVFQNRFSGIAAKSDLTVEDCTFIGSTTYTNARAIIFGEGATTASLNASIEGCTFTNWKYGVTDEMGAKDTAKSVTISDSTFNAANVQVSATENVTLTDNTMDKAYVDVRSYTNLEAVKVTATGNTLADNGAKPNTVMANPNNITTDDTSLKPVAKYDANYFMSMDALLASLNKNNTITLTADLDLLNNTLTLPADVTFNGNGKNINGYLAADGNVTFEGHTKVTKFDVNYVGLTVTISEGACLEFTGTGRMSIGSKTTFNIKGNVTNAKTADKAAIQPSLIAAGASFAGSGVNFNVTNAYIKFTAYCSSKNSSANGTFNFNVTNSIWDQTGSLVFSEPTNGNDPTFNFNLKGSVLHSTSHLVFAVTKGDVVFDNSNVNVDNRQQLENRSTLTVKNGSIVHATINTNENAWNPGTLIVDNATYDGTGAYTGGKFGSGMIVAQNKATVQVGSIDDNTTVYKDTSSSIKVGSTEYTPDYSLDFYKISLTTDKTALQANESLHVTVSIDKAYYSAEYTFTYDTSKFTCTADNDGDGEIYVTNLYNRDSGDLATYTLTAKNDINSVYTDNSIKVSGKVIQYKEQLLNGIENSVTGDSTSIKVSLNYTASVKADYVSGYSLVLVKGNDKGYAYNGVKMFYVEAYEAYAILVEGTVTTADIDAALSKTTDCETLTPSYNVNAEYVSDGIVDLKDATAVYACSALDFDVEDYMELFLRADVNGDGTVNIVDINAVTINYTK